MNARPTGSTSDHKNNDIAVADNGRASIGPHPTQRDARGKPMDALEVVMTILTPAASRQGGLVSAVSTASACPS
jgi:hypothetical protein